LAIHTDDVVIWFTEGEDPRVTQPSICDDYVINSVNVVTTLGSHSPIIGDSTPVTQPGAG